MRILIRKNYTIKIYKNGKVVSRLSAHSLRRSLHHLRSINFSKGIEKVYLRVSYRSHKDVFGKVSNDRNEGYFENKKDLIQAFEAFNKIGAERFLKQNKRMGGDNCGW